MRKLLMLSLVITAMNVNAQDVIVKKDGTTIMSKVLEVGTSEIKYKRYTYQDGPLFIINKSDVLSINYENGEKDLLSTVSEPSVQTPVVKKTNVAKEYRIEAGTLIPLQNVNYIRASQLQIGQTVNFRTSREIKVDDITVIPYGTPVKGKVYEAKKSSWFGTKGRLGVRINEIELLNGLTVPLTNGDIYVTGKNRTALSVILFLFVTWPACFICGSKAELPAGYEIVAHVANPVLFTEQDGRLKGKIVESLSYSPDTSSEQTPVVIYVKGGRKINALIASEDNKYIYYRKTSKPNGSLLKVSKNRVKDIVEIQ